VPRIFTFVTKRQADGYGLARFVFTPIEPLPERLLEEALSVRRDLETINLDIWMLLERARECSDYEFYLTRIKEAITAGLDSDLQGFSISLSLISQIREEFLKLYGEKFRADYIRRLTLIVSAVGIPAFIYGGLLSGWVSASQIIQTRIEAQVRTAAWGICGVCAAVWLSSVVRNRQLRWSNLTALDPDRLSPATRIGFVAVVTYIFALLIKLDAISVGIGPVHLADFIDQPSVTILVGLIGGLGGDAIVDTVLGRVRSVLSTK